LNRIQAMTTAYIEAIYFTDTGDHDQPPPDAELTPNCLMQAHMACRDFLAAIGGCCGYDAVDGADNLDPAQLGHDLWLTRNGHGAGFWDRPAGTYSPENAALFTRLARAMGSHDAEFASADDGNTLRSRA
jgi:hypothetical protein